jgi:hypothetical protein
MRKSGSMVILMLLVCPCGLVYAQAVSNYLILQNIGSYVHKTQTKDLITLQPKTIPGYTVRKAPGILVGADHFDVDHIDTTYEATYESGSIGLGVEVEVTQHAGGDSDRWLLHEVERGFRRGDHEEQMTPARFRNIDGNKVFYSGLGGGTYRWLSNKIVVGIEYVDLQRQKPEPLELVRAYLAKLPSSVPATTIDRAHDEQWIKDEMERRLWLGDKWAAQLQTDQANLTATLEAMTKHLRTFLEYREKYYGVAGRDEQIALIGFRDAQNGTPIKNKLAEYKTWWAANKVRPINLP